MNNEQLLTAEQLATALGVSISSIRKMTSAQRIPSLSIGEKLSVRRYDLEAVMVALRSQVRPPRPFHGKRGENHLAGV